MKLGWNYFHLYPVSWGCSGDWTWLTTLFLHNCTPAILPSLSVANEAQADSAPPLCYPGCGHGVSAPGVVLSDEPPAPCQSPSAVMHVGGFWVPSNRLHHERRNLSHTISWRPGAPTSAPVQPGAKLLLHFLHLTYTRRLRSTCKSCGTAKNAGEKVT